MCYNIEWVHTERALERGVSPLVNGALSVVMVPLVWGAVVSWVACGVMSECRYDCDVSCRGGGVSMVDGLGEMSGRELRVGRREQEEFVPNIPYYM